jgi:glycosyltransferase involved in cell wall biosynthesis
MILRNKDNKGLVYSCNKALKHIDTPYFLRLDTDDYLSKDAISRIYDNLSRIKDGVFIVFNRWEILNGEDKNKKTRVTHDMFSWLAAGTVFKTNAVRGVGGYSTEYWEEYDLYLKLLQFGFKPKVSSDYIYFYRRGYGSMTNNLREKKKGVKSLINKWGITTLNRYGNFERFLSYYRIKIR